MSNDPQGAIVGRREQIAAEPRPAKLHPTDLAGEVAAVRDADDLIRVYRPEWVIVEATTRLADDPSDEAMIECANRFFEARYAGRVRDTDVRFVPAGLGAYATVQLQLRLPNLKGEFKTEALALEFAVEQGWTDAVVVVRNSKADHELRAYGVKKLAK